MVVDWNVQATDGATYRDLKVDDLLRERRDLVVEAEAVFAQLLRREHKVALALLFALQDDAVLGAPGDLIVDVEGAAGLDLRTSASLFGYLNGRAATLDISMYVPQSRTRP